MTPHVVTMTADLRDADLRDADLRGANLCGANLSGADLLGANLRDANLRGADLRRANLLGADLCDADLCDADLRRADLCGADLRGANLSGANLSGADLSGANLRDADLRGADLLGANLRDADLCGADLRGANLSGTCLDPEAPIPAITDDQIRAAGLEVVEIDGVEWLVGWRSARSMHVGETHYLPGTYEAPWLSVDQMTECHPGIYLGGKMGVESVPRIRACVRRDGAVYISPEKGVRARVLVVDQQETR